ncbi:MAG: penicillin-binding protein family, partial [Hyphomicrobiales bacterium]|nr:penicillin-binding protein family [Hyphomicrobiales bacterium]
NSKGDLIYRRDRDGAPLEQAIPAEKIAEMNNMLKEVVSGGTARAAILEGVTAAGKTGTTNAYRDAWFDGFTGNYVCTVWFGNDDSTSMNNMTGGSLPARTWHEIMAYAHQGIELKNPYGVAGPTPAVASAQAPASTASPFERPTTLSRRSLDVLMSIEDLFDAAQRAIAPRPGTSAANVPVRAAAVE